MTQLSRSSLAEQANATAPARLGQATAVEQSRAVAEVQAAVVVAQRCPRSSSKALEEMKTSCGMREMAERAFFRFPRAGQTITGPSIHLARELARCWGNIDYGLKELSRDDVHGQSEMLAFAWDLETNVRAETVFIVPHLRDKRGGPERLTDVRDIYENNANHGARRMREQIFAVLPPWFTERAETICHETLQNGGGEPMPVRIERMVEAFSKLGVTKPQIERRCGCAIDKIDAVTLANLQIVFTSLRRGEVRKEDEFPADKAAAIESGLKGGEAQPSSPAEPVEAERPEPAPAKQQDFSGAIRALQGAKDRPGLTRAWTALSDEAKGDAAVNDAYRQRSGELGE